MKIVFVLRHGGYVRNFESALLELAGRGHDVHAALGSHKMRWLEGRRQPIVALAERCERITYGPAPDTGHALGHVALGLRAILDWLRYLRPEYEHAPKLRGRAEARVPAAVRRVLLATGAATPVGNNVLRRALDAAERSLPWAPAIDAWLDEHRPDVLGVTPLVDLGTSQPDILRAAHARGIPTVHCVASWDNLTNKGLIRGEPDVVTVWNEPQREEAIRLHRQPPERVRVTGAQSYDHWFGWSPRREREAFCSEVGLDPGHPFVVFLGSSPFVAPQEVPFVRRWVAALRAAGDPAVRALGVLVRPHPQNGAQWERAGSTGLDGVAVWPRAGADPIDEDSRADYHDSLFHSAAVVGINTSALIESAIVGRPVLTLLDASFTDTQSGTLHFEHLRRAGGGLLREAGSLPEHVAQLAGVLAGDDGFAARNRSFLEAFVRPAGLDTPAAPVLADAIEGASCRAGAPAPPAQRAARAVATALARAAS